VTIETDPNTNQLQIDRRDDAGGVRYVRTLLGTPRAFERYQVTISVQDEPPGAHVTAAGLLLDRDEVLALYRHMGDWLMTR